MTLEKYTKEQLAEILALHHTWLFGEPGGSRADLRNANLRNADLSSADLSSAYLSNADLRNANLRNADLSSAYLSNADLSNANLRNADLSSAYLSNADLSNANLRNADLSNADLRSAYLSNADLRSADLRSADLRSADLSNAKNFDVKAIRRAQIVPETGAFEAYKRLANGSVCRIRIPAEAGRVGGLIGRKCRAEFAEVLEGEGRSMHNGTFAYVVGQIVRPDKWDPNPLIECSGGIHFFLTRLEAEEYA